MNFGIRARRALQLLLVFMLGLYSLAAQTLLFRSFLGIYDGSEIGIGVFFSSWLLWVALGALACRLLLNCGPKISFHFDLLILLYIPAFILQQYLIDHSRVLAGVAAYEAFPLLKMIPLSILVNAPTSIITGLLFPLACVWISTAEDQAPTRQLPVATTYILEALGAFTGGILITLMLWLRMSDAAVFACSALALAVASSLYRLLCQRRWVVLAIPISIAIALTLGADRTWNDFRNRSAWERMMPADDYRGNFTTAQTPYLFGISEGQFNLLAWGSVAESIPQSEHAAEVVALTLAQHPRAKRILVLGAGSYSICSKFAEIPSVTSVTWVTGDPQYTARLLEVIPQELRSRSDKIASPAQEIKTHLRSATDEHYDLVLLNLPAPDTLLLNRYFTSEFYELIKSRMAANGVVAVRIRANENFIGGELARIGASVYATLQESFANIVIKPGDESWLLASDGDGLLDAPGRLRNRFRGLPGAARIYPPEDIRSLYRRSRAQYQLDRYTEVIEQSSAGELINNDRHPKALLNIIMASAREQGADADILRAILVFARYGFFWIMAALLIYGILRCGIGQRGGRPSLGDSAFLVWSTGIVGLTLSVVLMFVFQSRFGSIYLYAGLMSSLFMLGLFCGGLIFRQTMERTKVTDKVLILSILTHALICPLLYWTAGAIAQTQFTWLFLLSGTLSGAYVPIAARQLQQAQIDAGRAGSLIDACDHLGGACGALLTGLVLLPLFGSLRTLSLMAVLLIINIPGAWRGNRTSALQHPNSTDRRAGRIGRTLFAVALLALVVSNTIRSAERGAGRSQLDLKAAADQWSPKSEPRSVELPDGSRIEYYHDPESGDLVYATGDLATGVKGYNGPIEMVLMTSSNGTLKELKVVRERETPYYMRMLKGWIESLPGMDLLQPGLTERVDAVSGATASSEAILRSLELSAGIMRSATNGAAQVAAAHTRARIDPGAILVLTLIPLVLWMRGRPTRRLRSAHLALIVIVFGLYFNAQYSFENVTALLGLRLPSPGLNMAFVMTAGVAVLVLLFGNIYCGYMCPFGALQELLGDMLPKRWQLSPVKSLWRLARWFKYGLLFLLIFYYAFVRRLVPGFNDPLVSAFGNSRALLAGPIAALLVISIFFKRFWCRNLCPAGAWLALLNRVKLLAFARKHVRPGHCDLGVNSRENLDCINCDRCRYADAQRPRQSRTAGWLLLCATIVYAGIWLGDLSDNERPPSPESARTVRAADPDVAGVARNVEMVRMMRMIESGELSDREALYYEDLQSKPASQ